MMQTLSPSGDAHGVMALGLSVWTVLKAYLSQIEQTITRILATCSDAQSTFRLQNQNDGSDRGWNQQINFSK
jgi:hypothetical protein